MAKKFDFKQFVLEKGERFGLYAAAGLALLLLVLSLFMPGKGLFSGSASANVKKLQGAADDLARKQQQAKPGPGDQPPALDEAMKDFKVLVVKGDDYPPRSLFYPGRTRDTKRQMPEVLHPEEYQTAVALVQLPSLEFSWDRRGDKLVPTRVWVMKNEGQVGGAGAMGMLPGPSLSNLGGYGARGGQSGPGLAAGDGDGPGGMGGPPGFGVRGGMGAMGGAGGQGGKATLVPLAEAEGNQYIPATKVVPLRMAIVAASFPYAKQVAEFRNKLRLEYDGQVLTERVRGPKANEAWASFQFRGLEVERMTLGQGGKETTWESIDVDKNYKPVVLYTNRNFLPEEKYAILRDISDGLVMGLPKTYQKNQYPDLLDKLEKVKATLDKLQNGNKENVIRGSRFIDDEFSSFSGTSITGGKGGAGMGGGVPGFPMPPQQGMTDGEYYGPLAGEGREAQIKETPVDHVMMRFVDVTVQPGKQYKYRFKVRMANPNYSPKPAERKDTYPMYAKDKEIKSSRWAEVPEVISVPPESYVYAVDQRVLEPSRFSRSWPPSPSQAVVQIHRWVDFYSPNPDARPKPVAEWLVAPRVLVERGEYVRSSPDHKTLVPVKNLDSQLFEFDTNPRIRNERFKRWMEVPFGDETLLVDFESVAKTTRKQPGSERTETIEDRTATELLMMLPDGRLIARNSADDGPKDGKYNKEREERYKAWTERMKKIDDKEAGSGSLFEGLGGTGGMPPTGGP